MRKNVSWFNPVKQPADSKLCGHCCVATVIGKPLKYVIKKIGHENGTTTKELMSFFREYKKHLKEEDSMSICAARPVGKNKGNWHWVVSMGGRVYDPNYGCWLKKEAWELETGLKITSWNTIIF